MTLIQTEFYRRLLHDANCWHQVQYERVPPLVLLGILLALAIGAIVILAHENKHLTAWCRQVDEINRELHRKLDEAEANNKDLQAGFHELKMENDRLQGEVLK